MSSPPLSLSSDPIPRLLWQIGIPASVGMLFNTLFNFADTYCAGLLNTNALAALSLTSPFFFLLIAVGSGLSQGATALIGNALGKNDRERAVQLFAQSLHFAVGVGVLFSILGLLAAPSVFRALGATGSYLEATLAFMDIILTGSVFFILTMATNSALIAQGLTRPYRNFLILGFLGNCLLDPLLMWGLIGTPALGVSGIALSTVIIQIVGCGFLWRMVRRTQIFQSLPIALFKPELTILRQIAAQSVPAALNMMTIALGIFVVMWYVKQFGQEAIAATGIATRIEQVILMPAIGMSTAMISIVGHNYGAGLTQRVREAWQMNIKIGIGLMAGGGIVLGFFGHRLMSFFSHNPTVILVGRNYLWAAAFTIAAYPILFTTLFMMQGMKRPGYGLWIGIYRQIVAPMIICQIFVFTFGWGLWGVWWGFCLVTWSAALFALGWGWRAVRPV